MGGLDLKQKFKDHSVAFCVLISVAVLICFVILDVTVFGLLTGSSDKCSMADLNDQLNPYEKVNFIKPVAADTSATDVVDKADGATDKAGDATDKADTTSKADGAADKEADKADDATDKADDKDVFVPNGTEQEVVCTGGAIVSPSVENSSTASHMMVCSKGTWERTMVKTKNDDAEEGAEEEGTETPQMCVMPDNPLLAAGLKTADASGVSPGNSAGLASPGFVSILAGVSVGVLSMIL